MSGPSARTIICSGDGKRRSISCSACSCGSSREKKNSLSTWGDRSIHFSATNTETAASPMQINSLIRVLLPICEKSFVTKPTLMGQEAGWSAWRWRFQWSLGRTILIL